MLTFQWPIAETYRITATSIRPEGSGISKSYRPLEDAPWLHREFAAISPEGYPAFASEFGMLGLGGEVERLSDWEDEWKVLKKSLSFVDALWGRRPPAWQEDLIPRRVLETFSPLGRGFSRESRLWVRKALQELLTAKLRLHTTPDCTIELNRLKPALTPRGLIGAIWLLAAQAAAGERDVIACGRCYRWITVGRVKGGRRMDTKFCSDSCRVGSYQSRSRHAGKLLRYGLTPERVAFYSGLSRRALRRRVRK